MDDKKIVIEIEIDYPDDCIEELSDSEIFQFNCDIKEAFQERTGYTVENIYTYTKDK